MLTQLLSAADQRMHSTCNRRRAYIAGHSEDGYSYTGSAHLHTHVAICRLTRTDSDDGEGDRCLGRQLE